MIFLNESKEGLLLSVHAQPGASRTKIAGEHGGNLKIAVQAPPVDGAANEAITEFLAEILGIARRDVLIKTGATGRKKTFLLLGLTLEEAKTRLGEHL